MSAPAKGSEGSRLARQPPAPGLVSSFPTRAGLALHARCPSAAGSKPEVVLIHCKARLQRVRPADPLQPRGDLGVIQVGMIAAPAVDELEPVGVTAFHPAVVIVYAQAP